MAEGCLENARRSLFSDFLPMKKFEPILDDEGNILMTSDEVAMGVSFYEA